MKYYSTNKQAPVASLEEAVVKGLAGDKGLYMPEYIDSLDEEVIANMKNQSFHEKASRPGKGLANAFRTPHRVSHRSLRRSYGRIAVPVQSYPVLEQIHPST